MKVIIAGGSTFEDLNFMLDSIQHELDDISIIVSGRSFGADAIAEKLASSYAKDLELFPANWGKYGENAGYDRWLKVFKTQDIDKVILFWNGKSLGTKTLKILAREFDIPCDVYYYEERQSGYPA